MENSAIVCNEGIMPETEIAIEPNPRRIRRQRRLDPKVRLKILMLERGETPASLASALDLSVDYVHHLIAGSMVSKRGRARLEAHFREKIWPEPVEPAGEQGA